MDVNFAGQLGQTRRRVAALRDNLNNKLNFLEASKIDGACRRTLITLSVKHILFIIVAAQIDARRDS